jgi:hypothetical protein
MVRKNDAVPDPKQSPEEILARLKASPWDSERRVTDLETRLKVTLAGRNLYVPAVLKSDMDHAWGRPVTALATKAEADESRLYFRAVDPSDRGRRQIHPSRSMGAGYVSVGLPLRKLGVKLEKGRRAELDVSYMDDPELGRVYWIEFDHLETEPTQVDPEEAQARNLVKTELQQAKKAARIRKILARRPAPETP